MAAAQTLWFLGHANQTHAMDLRRYRPWCRQESAPSQLDIVWACREALHEAGVFPIPRFVPDLAEHHEVPEHVLPPAAESAKLMARAAGLTDRRGTMRDLMRDHVPLPAWVAPKRRGRPPKWTQQPATAVAA